jgi:hypothetical protein
MATATKKTTEVKKDKKYFYVLKYLTTDHNGDPKENSLTVTMSFGKVARLSTIFADLNDAMTSSNSSMVLNTVAVESLVKVDPLTGEVADEDKRNAYAILEQLDMEQGLKFSNWVMDHIIDFLLEIQTKQMEMIQSKTDLMKALSEEVKNIKALASSPDGMENLALTKPVV